MSSRLLAPRETVSVECAVNVWVQEDQQGKQGSPCIHHHAHHGGAEGCQQCEPNKRETVVPVPIPGLQQHRAVETGCFDPSMHTLVMWTQHKIAPILWHPRCEAINLPNVEQEDTYAERHFGPLGVRAVAHPENVIEDLSCHIPIHLAMQH